MNNEQFPPAFCEFVNKGSYCSYPRCGCKKPQPATKPSEGNYSQVICGCCKQPMDLSTSCCSTCATIITAELDPITARDKRIQQLEVYKKRLDWLHEGSGIKDSDGYEWGVARVKFDEHGQVVAVLWTDSDSADLDAEMKKVK